MQVIRSVRGAVLNVGIYYHNTFVRLFKVHHFNILTSTVRLEALHRNYASRSALASTTGGPLQMEYPPSETTPVREEPEQAINKYIHSDYRRYRCIL